MKSYQTIYEVPISIIATFLVKKRMAEDK